MFKKIIVIVFLLVTFYAQNCFTQSFDSLAVIVDPIETYCYQIFPDNPIKHYNNNTDYIGKVLFTAKVNVKIATILSILIEKGCDLCFQ